MSAIPSTWRLLEELPQLYVGGRHDDPERRTKQRHQRRRFSRHCSNRAGAIAELEVIGDDPGQEGHDAGLGPS